MILLFSLTEKTFAVWTVTRITGNCYSGKRRSWLSNTLASSFITRLIQLGSTLLCTNMSCSGSWQYEVFRLPLRLATGGSWLLCSFCSLVCLTEKIQCYPWLSTATDFLFNKLCLQSKHVSHRLWQIVWDDETFSNTYLNRLFSKSAKTG